MIIPNTNIIPISYMPGTGGVFLTNFINATKQNFSEILNISENFGHSHNNKLWRMIQIKHHLIEDDSLSIIKKVLVHDNAVLNPPCFGAYHISDESLIQLYFKKNIRIVYDQSDLIEITLSFIGKWEIDHENIPTTPDTYSKNLKRIQQFLPVFNPVYKNSNTCYVSWKDLTRNDSDELIEKLHDFTSIPKEKFFIENLVKWRIKTFTGIEKTKELLNTKYNTGDILC